MHQPRRRFGQNFLCDQQVIEKIVAAINPQPSQFLVEIGPGQGALTVPVLQQSKQLTLIELDKDLIAPLKQKLSKFSPEGMCQVAPEGMISLYQPNQVTIYQADALTFNFSELTGPEHKLRVFGNLPYNISTPVIFHLLEHAVLIDDMTFMLQKEVVERMCAQPGSKVYGRLSVMVQYHCRVQQLFNVAAEAFFPKPKVISAIVGLRPHEKLPTQAVNYLRFADIVRAAFTQRRKTLTNALRGFITTDELIGLSINPNLRPELLTVADFVKIANFARI